MSDPIYKTKAHKHNVAYWRGRGQLDCQAPICESQHGRAIDMSSRGAWGLDVGHIVAVVVARANGWTEAQINALTNTRPEHRRCNRTAGARDGAARRWGPRPRPVASRAW